MATRLDFKGAAIGALLGGLLAGLLNIGIYFAGAAAGATYAPKDPAVLGGMETLPFFQPLVICMIAAVAAVIVLFLLTRLAPARAWPIFLGLSVLAFVAELFPPTFVFEDMTTILTLEIMHIPAVIFVVLGVQRFGATQEG